MTTLDGFYPEMSAYPRHEEECMQAYSDPSRESEPYALPDVEVFEVEPGGWSPTECAGDYETEDQRELEPGWYWWSCFPGCLPDSEPVGPFDTEADALADAQGQD